MSGARSRTSGHNHERWVAQQYRAKWPDKVVRRALQAHSAFEPDVVVEGVPIWTECCTGAAVSPLKKLEQAERDVARCLERAPDSLVVPVVVWRQKRERTVRATMRLWSALATVDVNEPFYQPGAGDPADWLVVTLDFERWLDRVALPEADFLDEIVAERQARNGPNFNVEIVARDFGRCDHFTCKNVARHRVMISRSAHESARYASLCDEHRVDDVED